MPSCFSEPLVGGCALDSADDPQQRISVLKSVGFIPGVDLWRLRWLHRGLWGAGAAGPSQSPIPGGLRAPQGLGRVYPQVLGPPLSLAPSRLRCCDAPLFTAPCVPDSVLCPKLEERGVRLSPGRAQTPLPFRTPGSPLPAGSSTPGVHPPPSRSALAGGQVSYRAPVRARRTCELPSPGDLLGRVLPSGLTCCWSGEVGSQGVTHSSLGESPSLAVRGWWTPGAALATCLPGVQTVRRVPWPWAPLTAPLRRGHRGSGGCLSADL